MTHPWHDVTAGENLPGEFMAVIEIPTNSSVKYEIDETGLLKVDRLLYSAVHNPANYGFIPQTLAEDDDALDVLVLCKEPLYPLSLVNSRTIGLMTMIDSGKKDHKILAVAVDDPEYNTFQEASELPQHRLLMLRRFGPLGLFVSRVHSSEHESTMRVCADSIQSLRQSCARRLTCAASQQHP